MKKYDYKISGQIPDCWRVAEWASGRLYQPTLHNKSMEDCILETWQIAHSYQEQLIGKDETIRKRNMLVKQLRIDINVRIDIANELTKQVNALKEQVKIYESNDDCQCHK